MSCWYPGCGKKAFFEIFWDSHGQEGEIKEPDDYDNYRKSCNIHILAVIESHFGYPIDDIWVYENPLRSLPKLKEIINNPEKRGLLKKIK